MTILHRYSLKAVIILLLEAGLVSVPLSTAHAVWETLVDGTSFNSVSAFQNKWSYNYPWGMDHNGSARMNQTNVAVSGGVVNLTSSLTNSYEGNSSKNPYLTIRYWKAFHLLGTDGKGDSLLNLGFLVVLEDSRLFITFTGESFQSSTAKVTTFRCNCGRCQPRADGFHQNEARAQ
jgi:hypothetical protein